jgi:hypothetical protein
MINIREGVFETNSSSNHSLHLAKRPVYDYTIIPDNRGVILLWGDFFGQGSGEEYNDALTKAEYLATSLVASCNYELSGEEAENKTEECETVRNEAELNKLEKFLINRATYPKQARRLANIIKKHTGAKFVLMIPSHRLAGIDHQSIEEGPEFMESHSDEEVKLFLFSSESFFRSDYG